MSPPAKLAHKAARPLSGSSVGSQTRSPGRRVAPPWLVRWLILVGLVSIWEAASRRGLIDPFTAPPPSEIAAEIGRVVQSDEFLKHLSRTLVSLFSAFGIAFLVGVPTGVLLWRVRVLGAALEPYLLTMRAVPPMVFYPILLAFLGLNAGPIITISAVMAVVPIIIFTMVALRSVNPTLRKLAASLNLSGRQTWRKVLLPAATPLALPGVKQGFIYALLATVAMEFILADRGLGFRIGLANMRFEVVTMYAYLAVVVVISVVANGTLSALERRVRRDLL